MQQKNNNISEEVSVCLRRARHACQLLLLFDIIVSCALCAMASSAIDAWRQDPIRWSHRILRPIFKPPDNVLRKVKSFENVKDGGEGLEVIQEVVQDLPDDGYVEDEGVIEEPLLENQVGVSI